MSQALASIWPHTQTFLLRLPICKLSFAIDTARTTLNCYLAFILALLPSSIMQLMDISGIAVSPGAMALACILERLDGMVISSLVLASV